MGQSTIGSVFSGENLPRHAACILLKLSLIAVSLLRKPVSPPPRWFRHDTLQPVARPPPWPDWCEIWFSSTRSYLLFVTIAFIEDECF